MFHCYEKGRSQLVIQVQEEVVEYPIVATDPPDVKGAKETEFNESVLFFGFHKNHTLVLQNAALHVGSLSDYLNWLLQDATVRSARRHGPVSLPGIADLDGCGNWLSDKFTPRDCSFTRLSLSAAHLWNQNRK